MDFLGFQTLQKLPLRGSQLQLVSCAFLELAAALEGNIEGSSNRSVETAAEDAAPRTTVGAFG